MDQTMSDKKSYIDPVKVSVPNKLTPVEADRKRIYTPVKREAKEQKKQPKQKLKDKAMEAIMKRVWTFIRDVLLQWIFPFPIYKKQEDGKTPIIDPVTKKPVIDWFATVSARGLSLIVVAWGTVEVLGMSVGEWAQRIAAALGLPI